jgi:hypothetical protein
VRDVPTIDEEAAMTTTDTCPAQHQNVPAVFDDHAHAEAAVEALRRLGIADDHLGIAIHEPGAHVYEQDAERETLDAVRRGLLVGVPLGALAGIGLIAVALPGVAAIGIGGALAGVPSGTMAGGFLGGLAGLLAKVRLVDDEERWAEIPLAAGDVLLVVRTHDREQEVCEILERHGGRCVTTDQD